MGGKNNKIFSHMHNCLYNILRGLYCLAFLAIVVAGFVVIRPRLDTSRRFAARKEDLQRKIDDKKRQIKEIQGWKKRLNEDPSFLEALGRRNRYFYPGEVVFVFEK